MATRTRDYSREYKQRQERNKRLSADVERETAESLLKHLSAKNETYIDWLKKRIAEELKRA